MELLSPGIGLVFWMTLTFLILFLVLRKYAWPVILKMLKDREETIATSLQAAEDAKKQLEELQKNNHALLKETQAIRDSILRETREEKEAILEEARKKAKEDYDKLMRAARENIHYEKMAAITEVKNEIAAFSITISEKVLQSELSDLKKQEELIQKTISDLRFN